MSEARLIATWLRRRAAGDADPRSLVEIDQEDMPKGAAYAELFAHHNIRVVKDGKVVMTQIMHGGTLGDGELALIADEIEDRRFDTFMDRALAGLLSSDKYDEYVRGVISSYVGDKDSLPEVLGMTDFEYAVYSTDPSPKLLRSLVRARRLYVEQQTTNVDAGE